MENIEPALKNIKDMLQEFEGISMKMAEPDADIDALANKMDKLQVGLGWDIPETCLLLCEMRN